MMLVDRFRLVRPAGEGSIGVVWVAEDTGLNDEQVACKILREELSRKREAIAALASTFERAQKSLFCSVV